MSFAVVRHPDIDTLGVIPEGALEMHRARGWIRVSDWRREPADFHLPEFAEVVEDLDAPKPKAKPKPEPVQESEDPAEKTEESTE